MFPNRYFPERYFPDRYFPLGEDAVMELLPTGQTSYDLLEALGAEAQRESDEFFERGVPFFVGVFGDAGPPTPVAGVPAYPKLVMVDRASPIRTRQHQEHVSAILNSLIRNGTLQFTEIQEYVLAYTPDDAQDWAPGAPETIQDAFDRIAALLKTLNGGVGP